MNSIDLQPVQSSQIAAIGHDPNTNTLAVQFNRGYGSNREPGPLYHYQNVSAADYEAFRSAESLGRHFKQHFKPFPDKHPYTRVADDERADAAQAAG